MSRPCRQILVLGDSSMASFGGCHDTAIDAFASRTYNVPVDVVNGSFAGMTAADVLVHVRRELRARRPDAILVCVGHCDASAFGPAKPFSRSPLTARLTRIRERRHRRHSLYRRNPPGEFVVHDSTPIALHPAVSPEAHGRYLDAIARACRDARVPLIVIVPVANSSFPPCNNIGNVAFYRILNVPDDHDYRAPAEAAGLLTAFAAEARGDLAAARRAYDDVIRAHPRDELADIARNNLACLGPPGESSAAFTRAIRAESPLAPIAAFNQCVAALLAGRGPDESVAHRAMDADAGSYRITGPYRTAAMAALRAHAGADVTVIDAACILADDDFLDYAHPAPPAHTRLFAAVAAGVENRLGLGPGAHPCSVRTASMNPDAHTGASAGVFEHFDLVREPDNGFVEAVLAAARSGPPVDSSPRSRAIARFCRHPLFGDADVLAACSPSAPTDQGALTELFFLRHMRPLYERDSVSDATLLATLAPIRPHPARVDRWWGLTGVPFADPGPLLRAVDPGRLLARSRARFAGIIDAGPVAAHRYRSIAYWFLRESLVFGSPSHATAYLDRLAARDVLDACTAGLGVAAPGSPEARGFENLLDRLARLVRLHDEHVGPFASRLFLMGRERLEAYRRACESLRER